MIKRKSFRCEFLDWHTPTTHVSGITILESTCKRCGRRILQGSLGNWFSYCTAIQKENENEKH